MARASWQEIVAYGLMLASMNATHAAQPMRFDRLGVDDGLAQQSANAIAQDATGYLWIGTEEGLDRYDGYTFQHSRHERAVPRSLSNDFIGGIALDRQGAIWVATDGGGVVRRDPASGEFTPLPSLSVDRAGLERVRALRFDRVGRLWMASRDAGVAVYDPDRRQLVRYRHDAANAATLGDDSTFALLEDSDGMLWVGTAVGVDRLDPKTRKIQSQPLRAAGDPATRRFSVRALLDDRRGAIWVGTDAGLVRIDRKTGGRVQYRHAASQPRSLPEGQVNALLEDSRGRIWVGTDGGLARLDATVGLFDVYRHEPADPASLPDDQVRSLFEDRSGLLWVGTKFGGLARWNPRAWSLGHHTASVDEGFASSNITSFAEDAAGRLWVGSIGGGLVVLDRTGIATSIRHDPRRADSLSDDRVMSLFGAHDGSVWVGTMNGGLNHIVPENDGIQIYRHDPADLRSLGASGVMSLLEDSVHRLWAGTYGGGLARFEPKTGKFVRYLADARVTALAEDRSGRIWAGTDGRGLHILDPVSGQSFAFRHDDLDLKTLSADTIYSLHVDAKGTVWVGTRGGGLDRVVGSALQPQSIEFANLSERDGLPNNTICGTRSDGAGNIWVSTNHGLARIDPRTLTVRAFHRSQGLQGEEFNFGAHYATRRGDLLFGGANGYNRFDPEMLEFNRLPPPVTLTGILHSGKPLSSNSMPSLLAPLRIDSRDSAIEFEFAALDFAAPQANRFEYVLQGTDRQWRQTGPQRSVSYPKLDGGHYTLHVRAANADGVWNDAGPTISLEVSPPPWKSAWAYAGYGLALCLLSWIVWLGHKYSIEREARYRRTLEEQVLNRTRELAERARELELANRKLEEVSLSDALTGLGNRRALIGAMPQLTAVARNQLRPMALMLVDLDNLKPINDAHGHEYGDRVLASVARELRSCLNAEDRLVRWGGDEFVIVRADADLEKAAAFAERVRNSISRLRFAFAGDTVARTTCSIGFAVFPFVPGAPDLLSWEEVLHLADVALYRAKTYRNAWAGWTGKHASVAAPDLAAMLSGQFDVAGESDYVEWRTSRNADLLNIAI